MKSQAAIPDYTIKDVIDYRSLAWPDSKDFLYLTQVPLMFESDFVRPDYYCFGMISGGLLEININNNLYNLSANSLMIYRPGQLWKVSRVAEGTMGSFVLFTRKFLDSLNENIFSIKSHSFLSQGIQSLIELNTADYEKVKSLFSQIFTILRHLSKSSWEPVARNLTSALIYETDDILANYIDTHQILSNKEDELFARFNALVTIHFKTNRKPEFYASRLCVTTNYLYSVIKKISGKTPTDLINRQVMREARYMVGYTLASFAGIASDLNFSDPFTFSKYFKKNTGYSPSHYRNHADALTAAHEN
ncbi:AraC family transcriptional regulator [Mucilaginibacter sp. L196]|uniref:helix-turn-helix domain-containing protein n=1 Tax=Mucilaginibacter sp. L196 TaxID=1641870 RepID=UPI00131B2344|nr:helix-turn-helix domain-containing protein [Mucilaginibacter sp. L196]